MDRATQEHERITAHCQTLKLPSPSTTLTSALRAKFPELKIEQVIERLPRFDGQTSPGLWRDMAREQLEREAERQRNPVLPAKKGVELSLELAQQNILKRMGKA